MKRYLCILLCVLFALGTLPAFASAEEKVVLKVYYSSPELYPGWEYGDDPVSGKIEEMAGVDIQYSYATTSGHQELYTMLAAGTIEAYDMLFTGTYIPALVDEGYALALDEIATEYDHQPFWDLLPTGLMGAHGIDGHLYYSVSQYGDSELLSTVVAGKKAPTNFTVNYSKMVGEVGIEDHSLTTLADVEAAAAKAKAAGVEYPILCVPNANPLYDLSFGQTLNACFAGPGFVYPQADGTVTFNYKSEEYKSGIRWLNEMYRKGLVQADNFTFTTSVNDETVKAIALAGNVGFIVGHTWMIEQHLADYMNYRRWKLIPTGEGVNPEDIMVTDWNASQTGAVACFIMDSTEHPLECLKWITTYWEPEVQVMSLYGIEGLHYTMDYTYDPAGDMIKNPDMLNEQANMTATEFQKKWGYFNNCISNYRGRYGQVYFDRPTKIIQSADGSETIMGDYDVTLGPDYAVPFKTGNLAVNLTDADQNALLSSLRTVWNNNLITCVLAGSEAEFEASYETLLAQMEKAGMAEMEEILTERYWTYADELQEVRNAKWEAASQR